MATERTLCKKKTISPLVLIFFFGMGSIVQVSIEIEKSQPGSRVQSLSWSPTMRVASFVAVGC